MPPSPSPSAKEKKIGSNDDFTPSSFNPLLESTFPQRRRNALRSVGFFNFPVRVICLSLSFSLSLSHSFTPRGSYQASLHGAGRFSQQGWLKSDATCAHVTGPSRDRSGTPRAAMRASLIRGYKGTRRGAPMKLEGARRVE